MSGNTKLTQEELEAIRERVKNATTAPWKVESGEFSGDNWLIAYTGADESGTEYYITTNNVRGSEMDGDTKSDAQFIAHARTDIPRLLAEIERLGDILHDAYIEIQRGKGGRAIDIIEEWGGSE